MKRTLTAGPGFFLLLIYYVFASFAHVRARLRTFAHVRAFWPTIGGRCFARTEFTLFLFFFKNRVYKNVRLIICDQALGRVVFRLGV